MQTNKGGLNLAKKIAALAGVAVLSASASAASVGVTSYDFYGAYASGFGGWSNTYSGAVTDLGNGAVNYTGGSGTLNDGVVSSYINGNQLFPLADSSIVLHLGSTVDVSSISLFGASGDIANFIPGTITGVTVTIDGTSVVVPVTSFGPTCTYGYNGRCDGELDLSGTGLSNLSTSSITLSDFQGGWSGYANLTEVTVDGVSAVPEPQNIALMLAGVALVGLARRAKRASTQG